MPNFHIELAEPEKLLFLFILRLIKKHVDGELFSMEIDRSMQRMIGENNARDYLDKFVSNKIIKEFYLLHLFFDKDRQIIEDQIRVYYIAKNQQPREVFDNIEVVSTHPRIWIEETHEKFNYKINLNVKRADQYIDEYLDQWEKDDLYFVNKNILRKEFQIKIIVDKIFRLIDKYPHKNLLIPIAEKDSEEENIDPVATIIFLEKNGDLVVTDYNSIYLPKDNTESITKAVLRITLKDKFFQDFSIGKDGPIFNFDDIKSQKKIKKIVFHPPNKLVCKDKKYSLNKGGFPYELMNRSFDGMTLKSVNEKELLPVLKMKTDHLPEKTIQNFRRSLRDKFGFPESEKFFTYKEGEIMLDSKIFQKIQK